MYDILNGLRIVEGSSFVAAPSCGLYLAQLGAEVIRFDHIGGGPDFRRWPKTPGGDSLYWEGLNKGKKSIAIDLRSPKGRDLAVRLATAPGAERGIFLTNYPADGFLSHANLAARRADMITLRVMGWGDGQAAIDNTVNAAAGVPQITGPQEGDRPVNHSLPAWDLLTGAYAAFSLLAAERFRRSSGKGQEVRIPLGDVAIAAMGNLGYIGEATVSGHDRQKTGNDLFGAFGRDFVAADGHRIMIAAISSSQWKGLVEALDLGDAIRAIEAELGVSFSHDEGIRFVHRERLFPHFEQAIGRLRRNEIAELFDRHHVTWGPYQGVRQALEEDPRFSEANPLLGAIEHPSSERYLAPGAAAFYSALPRQRPQRAARLGEHTDEVLATVLGLSDAEIARLHDDSVVAGPQA
jgi:2-methylfumaryl-CoA isomerase